MRILLTGSTGQVGGALLPLLGELGTVVAPPRALFDLARPTTLERGLDEISPDLIVNPAAYTAVDRAEDERELAGLVNARSPEAIANWALAHGVPIVHFSTDYVFNGSGSHARAEQDPTGPLSVYGESKLAGDVAVQASGARHLIFRTSWVYAAHGTNFLRTISRLASERKELRIVADQVGAPTSARSIAAAVMTILREHPGNLERLFAEKRGVVNVACSGQASWHEFAVAIVEGLRARGVVLPVEAIIPIATSDFRTRAVRPANSRLDLSRLRHDFRIAMPRWEDALAVELDEFAGFEAAIATSAEIPAAIRWRSRGFTATTLPLNGARCTRE
ncbi:dTDP-4-dehydrorhamnose reductase [Bradyrhizobium sp. MOS001]|uniref:dTDP-4-dehydrorhamnose reductase n=1 Tax=Bradyrhizobium barranii subsp. barranii TaxID=2823807 RepID=A0A939M4W1_9BRAD|nr:MULTISPECIES: dTDP-4-dehydrorhamnose reductase [Bradyrhizobium]TFW59925.1 dTDP-4-dehydrorhamnose reductase [Bradyrhizobium sp. MOS001]UEM15945.1 dTDP-4-dehydrorhamnose reductase [Bradyrhizobium barranii subsp. barranii]